MNAQVAAELEVELETEAPKKRKAPRKKRKVGEEDEAYKPEAEADYGRSGFSHKARPAAGHIEFCAKCNCRFTVTQYNKVDPDGNGLLCSACGALDVPGRAAVKPKAKPAARKKRAKATLDGQASLIPSLQDTCIKLIAKHIEDVEALGDIGQMNMDKICQIISRNRSLTNETVQLFFEANLKSLSLYDCAKIDTIRLGQIAQFCPNLQFLRLHMCGQITDTNVLFFAKHLKQLNHIILRGCFLVTIQAWTTFFSDLGPQLVGFEMSSSSRFNIETTQALVSHCPQLQTLSLAKLTHLTDEMVAALAPLTSLKTLDISHSGAVITDQSVIALLASVGSTLESLNLSALRELTDNVLLLGILPYCTNLQYLYLNDLDLLTDEGVHNFFSCWIGRNPALLSCQMERCPKVKDAGLGALLAHSGTNLRNLVINSMDELSHEAMLQLASGSNQLTAIQTSADTMEQTDSTKARDEEVAAAATTTTNALPNGSLALCKELDISWIRAVDDTVIHRILANLKNLEILRVWGNNRITECEQSTGKCVIVGRESG